VLSCSVIGCLLRGRIYRGVEARRGLSTCDLGDVRAS
jgi:hypothetical protein